MRVSAAVAALCVGLAPAIGVAGSGWSVSCHEGCAARLGVLELTLDRATGAPVLSLSCRPAGSVVLALPDNRAFAMETVLGKPLDAYWQSRVGKRGATLFLEREAQIAAQIPLTGVEGAIGQLRARTGTKAQTEAPAAGHLSALADAARHAHNAPRTVPQYKPQVYFATGDDTLTASGSATDICQ